MTVSATGKTLRLRVLMDQYDGSVLDVLANATPRLWRGNYARCEIGIFTGDATSYAPVDLSTLASLTVDVFAATRTGARLMSATVNAAAITNTITAEAWTARTAQNAVVEFTGDETNLDVTSGATATTYWMSIAGLTTHTPARAITFGGTQFTIEEDGPGNADAEPPAPVTDYATLSQIEAAFLKAQLSGRGWRCTGAWPEYYFPDGTWRALVPRISNGNPTFDWVEL